MYVITALGVNLKSELKECPDMNDVMMFFELAQVKNMYGLIKEAIFDKMNKV